MLEPIYIPKCDIETETEIKALKRWNNDLATSNFYYFHSPAANFVRQFLSEIFDKFNLPTLLAAMEIQDQKKDIDKLAETIEGANLLSHFDTDIWSCSRYNEKLGWVAVSNFGFADKNYLQGLCLAVPIILY